MTNERLVIWITAGFFVVFGIIGAWMLAWPSEPDESTEQSVAYIELHVEHVAGGGIARIVGWVDRDLRWNERCFYDPEAFARFLAATTTAEQGLQIAKAKE